jgi:predicted RNA binding protein YcfA (HicA-like mRNA interferase family)
MTKREKRLQKLRQNPNNVSFDELRQVLEAEGFVLDHARGSHYIFRIESGAEVLTVVIPFARPVKPVYVRQALTIIDQTRPSENRGRNEDGS